MHLFSCFRYIFHRAIFISLPLVTVLYICANIAYLAVMSPADMIESNAIAVVSGRTLSNLQGSYVLCNSCTPVVATLTTFFVSDICRPNDGQSSIFDAPSGGCVCTGEFELSHHDLQPLVFRWRQAGTLSRLPLTRLRQKLSTSTITSFSGQSKMITYPVGRIFFPPCHFSMPLFPNSSHTVVLNQGIQGSFEKKSVQSVA